MTHGLKMGIAEICFDIDFGRPFKKRLARWCLEFLELPGIVEVMQRFP